MRGIGIGRYPHLIYDEYYYVPAAQVLLGQPPLAGAAGAVPGIDPNLASHPPLAKELIALAILLFGNHPWAWRLGPALLGATAPVCTYVIARTLFDDAATALAAAFFMAGEGLAVSLSHVALLDSISFPLSLGALAWAVCLAKREREGRRPALGEWMGQGVLTGLSVAAKWSAGLTVPVVWLAVAFGLGRRRTVRRTAAIAVAETLVPCAAYAASYAYAWPHGFQQAWLPHGFWAGLVQLQRVMLSNMWAFRFYNPGESAPWTWILLPRPLELLNWVVGSHEVLLWTLSDPLWVWGGLVALGGLGLRAVRLKEDPRAVGFLGLWFAANWVPWLVTPRSHFYYYFLPALPPLLVALGRGCVTGWRNLGRRRAVGWALAVVLLASEAYVLPIAAGMPIPLTWIQHAVFLPQWQPKPSPRPGRPGAG
ncbi:MAG: glycosyltransferase family 39 protein [Firmicutes bacterium]|nr:glycosyltransferase family 39 protein [Alicyclobacillaceae bacterium]MCL6498269.1 glycosyltransferase family 39 protein [Bacillota bacterium]